MCKLMVLNNMISVGSTTLQLNIINTSRNMICLVSLKFLYVILRVRMARKKDMIKNIHDKSAIRHIEVRYKEMNKMISRWSACLADNIMVKHMYITNIMGSR